MYTCTNLQPNPSMSVFCPCLYMGKTSFGPLGLLVCDRLLFPAFIPNPHVSVSATKLQSYKVYVTGRVTKPGEYLVGHYTDVLQMLSLAGGLTPFASENDIKIIRRENGDQRVFLFRYGDVQKGRDLNQNILLKRGDVVMVP